MVVSTRFLHLTPALVHTMEGSNGCIDRLTQPRSLSHLSHPRITEPLASLGSKQKSDSQLHIGHFCVVSPLITMNKRM